MKTIRQSALNSYERCPHAFLEEWGEYGSPDREDNDIERQNKYSFTGIKFHETMEHWGQHKIAGTSLHINVLHDHLDERLIEVPSKFFDCLSEERGFRDSLHEQLDWIHDTTFDITPVCVEENFFIEELIPGLPPFTGTIDRVDGSVARKDVDILDYKTGKPYTRNECKSNMQACIYALYWKKKYGFYPKNFVFYYTKHKKSKAVPITPEFIEAGVERITNIWAHIMNGDFNPPMKPNKWFCNNSCKSETCKHKAKGKWGNVGFEMHNVNKNLLEDDDGL